MPASAEKERGRGAARPAGTGRRVAGARRGPGGESVGGRGGGEGLEGRGAGASLGSQGVPGGMPALSGRGSPVGSAAAAEGGRRGGELAGRREGPHGAGGLPVGVQLTPRPGRQLSPSPGAPRPYAPTRQR